MEQRNGLFAKSGQMNIIGLIGCALAVIGMILPVLSINVYITSIGIGHFQLTALVILPMLLIIGAAVLYILKMDKLAMFAVAVAFAAYLLIVLLSKGGSSTINVMGQEISIDELLAQIGTGIKYGFGFYLSIIGYLVAIAGAFVNSKIFKPKAAAAQAAQMYGPQSFQQNPYMNQPQANPYMNQGQPQQNPYMNQPQANPYMNQQSIPQQNPYLNQVPLQNAQNAAQAGQQMQQTAQQMNPYLQQGMPQMQQPEQSKTSAFAQQMQQAGQAVKKSLKKSDVNPYVQQAQNQAGQAMQQAEQFVQNNIPGDENDQ